MLSGNDCDFIYADKQASEHLDLFDFDTIDLILDLLFYVFQTFLLFFDVSMLRGIGILHLASEPRTWENICDGAN